MVYERGKGNWYLWVQVDGRTEERGPCKRYVAHLVGHQKIPTTKREAELLESAVELWVRRGRPSLTPPDATPPPTGGERKFKATFTEYRKRHLKKLAAGGDRVYAFEDPWQAEPLSVVLDQSAIEDYFAERMSDDEVRGTSINREYARLLHFANWCMGRKPVPYLAGGRAAMPFFHRTLNPSGIKKLPEGERGRRLDVEDLTRLVAHERPGEEARILAAIDAWAATTGEEMRGRVYCAIDAGLRRGEMLGLKREDVVWQHKDGLMLRVRWWQSKTRKERLVPVVTERLEDYLKARRFAPHPFGDAAGGYIESFQTVWNAVRKGAKIATGWDDPLALHWHDLRHECGSRFAEGVAGRPPVPLHELQLLMGHARLTTTQKYLNARLSSLAASMRKAVGTTLK